MDAPVKKIRVIFLGTGAIGCPSLEVLVGDPALDVLAVVTQPDRPAGRNLRLTASPIKVAAQKFGLPILQPETLRRAESLEPLTALNADIWVVVAYGQILPRTALEVPPLGCINVHASLLPRYRGASPIAAALLEGDPDSGMTIMAMDEGLDTGDILAQVSCPILKTDTAGSLHDRLALLAPQPLLEVIRHLHAGTQSRTPQNPAFATLTKKISKSAGRLDWSQSAVRIERAVRAFSPWPCAFTELPNQQVLKIHAAELVTGSGPPGTVLPSPAGTCHVAAGEGALSLLRVQAAGGRVLAIADYLRGRALPPPGSGLTF